MCIRDRNGNIVEAIVVQNGNYVALQLYAMESGTTDIVVETTVNGVTGQSRIPVTVSEDAEMQMAQIVDFRISGKPQDGKMEKHGWQVNLDETSDLGLNSIPVSYTHLDVYKRQFLTSGRI